MASTSKDLDITKYKDIENLEVHEEAGNYSSTIVLNRDKFREIQKENIDVPEGYNIRGSTKKEKLKSVINVFNKRENILYFEKSAVETTINIEDTEGNTSLQFIGNDPSLILIHECNIYIM